MSNRTSSRYSRYNRCTQSDDEYEELPPADYLTEQDEEPYEYDPYGLNENEYTTDDHVHYAESAPRKIPPSEQACFRMVNYGTCQLPDCPYNHTVEVNLKENLKTQKKLRDSTIHNAKADARTGHQAVRHVADRAHFTRDNQYPNQRPPQQRPL